MTTGLLYDERFLLHRAPEGHPEHAGRLEAIWSRFEREGLTKRCERVAARPATSEEILAVHTESLMAEVRDTASRELTLLDPDTYARRESGEAALLAAGGLAELTAQVLAGRLTNGLALARPPGHHAEADRAMGFCLFNNVAVASRAAQNMGARRILIVDWDVHHGNGTQNAFWDDAEVLYFSTHQYPFYPGTGAIGETGGPGARGRNMNVPWPAGMGDADYAAAFDRILLPAARAFSPDLVLVSAGFDAAAGDLLGGMRISPAGYAAMTSRLLPLAGGRLVLALEGGYNLDAISGSAAACLRVLFGASAVAHGFRRALPTGRPNPQRGGQRAGSLLARRLWRPRLKARAALVLGVGERRLEKLGEVVGAGGKMERQGARVELRALEREVDAGRHPVVQVDDHDAVLGIPGQQARRRLLDEVGEELVGNRNEGQRLHLVEHEGEESVLQAKLGQRRPRGQGDTVAPDRDAGHELAVVEGQAQVLQVGNPVDEPVDEGVQGPFVKRDRETAPADLKAVRLGGGPGNGGKRL